MVTALAHVLTQVAAALLALIDHHAGTTAGWSGAALAALALGAVPPLLLLLANRLVHATAHERIDGLVRTLRPVLRRIAGWSALVLAAVPLVLTGEMRGLEAGGIWYLAWTLVLALGLGGIWLVVRLTRAIQSTLTAITTRTTSPYDDLLAELALRIARGVLPIIIASVIIHALADHHGVVEAGKGLTVVAAIAWTLFQVVAMLDRLLLARMDLLAADNLSARRIATQVTVIKKIGYLLLTVLSLAAVLMQFEAVRQIGTSLIASVGLLSMIVGLAAQRTLSNLLAGIQIALTQPIRLDDVVIMEGEWGRIEEITLTYVVVRIWDQRRLIVPIGQLIDKPFQNWTRTSAEILGTVFLRCDYRVDLAALRDELKRLVEGDANWDRRVAGIQVTEAGERSIEVRALVSSTDAGRNWDLRCTVREGLIAFLQRTSPDALPHLHLDHGVFAPQPPAPLPAASA